MPFNPEDRIGWEELAPSLQKKITNTEVKHEITGQALEDGLNVKSMADGKIVANDLVKSVRAAGDTDDITRLKSIPLSTKEIFDTWTRISWYHYAQDYTCQNRTTKFDSNDDSVAGRNAYSYIESEQAIKNSRNSEAFTAFLSTIEYDANFEIEMEMEGIDTDDDPVGIIVGYLVDKNGYFHMLQVVRSGGIDNQHYTTFGLCYDSPGWYKATSYSGKGVRAYLTKANPEPPPRRWGVKTGGVYTANKVKLKVKKEGNKITAWTNDINDMSNAYNYSFTYYLPGNLTDLRTSLSYENTTSNTALNATDYEYIKSMMNDKTKIGVWTLSNPCKFKIGGMAGALTHIYIYDITTGEYIDYDTSTGKETRTTDTNTLMPGSLLYSVHTKKLFFIKNKSSYQEIDISVSKDEVLKMVSDSLKDSPNGVIYQGLVSAIKDNNNKDLLNAINTVASNSLKDSPNGIIYKGLIDAIKNNKDKELGNAFTSLVTYIFTGVDPDGLASTKTDETGNPSGVSTTFSKAMATNLPPKVGYLDEKYVPIQGSYNMSYTSAMNGPFYISDAEGRECIFTTASGSSISGAPTGVYRGTRMFSNTDFLWENNAIRPKFVQEMSGYSKSLNGPLDDNIRVTDIKGLTSDYVILSVYSSITNKTRDYMVFTKLSGSYENWSTSNGYVDVTDIGISYTAMCRVEYNKNVYYIVPSTKIVSSSVTDPVTGTVINRTDTRELIFTIYKAVENLGSHSVSLTTIREDNICIFYNMWDFDGTNINWNNSGSIQIIHLKHLDCLYVHQMLNTVTYGRRNTDNSYYTTSGGANKMHSGALIKFSNSNMNTALTSTTTHYFENNTNYHFNNLGYMYNWGRYGYQGWGLPFGYVVYDELKHNIAFTYKEHKEYGGVPSRGRLSIYDFNSNAILTDFINYFKTYKGSNFPMSLDRLGNYNNLKKSPITIQYSILTSDTAPWSKSIKFLMIQDDIVQIGAISKKYNSDVYIEPTLLRNSSGGIINSNIFTCAVGKWGIIQNSITQSNPGARSCVYTGGTSSTYYYLKSNGEVCKYNKVSFHAMNDANNPNTFSAYSYNDNSLVSTGKTIPNIDVETVLKMYHNSEIAKHSLTCSARTYLKVYGYNTKYGGDFVLYFSHLRISSSSIASLSATDLNSLKSYAPCIIIANSSGSHVYNFFDMTGIDLSSYIRNHMLTGSIDKSNITGYISGARMDIFFDKNGDIIINFTYHQSVGDNYAGPYMHIFNLDAPKNGATMLSPNTGQIKWVDKDFGNDTTGGSGPMWGQHSCGYSNSVGYWWSFAEYQDTYISLYCEKDYLNTSPTNRSYTCMYDMLTNSTKPHWKRMYTSASTGNIAFLSDTVIYLGGYFSKLPAKELELPYEDNYIYIVRDTVTGNITVEIYDHQIGIPGQSQFNRIMACMIKVVGGLIFAQTDYEINYYGI